ncbi:uncharacterized protein LOC125761999 [Anopheles funestus]|uniref:uncharacterized protein LOC125761999 n=1 Tax=Anopheles funestus TaxID=62324 RepID=UPI0020C73796|nr:uncharacterized protein LOC125761999 [Anopheles funestus]
MEIVLPLAKLNLETVNIFLEQHKLTDSTVKLTRSRRSNVFSTVPERSFKNITLVDIKQEINPIHPATLYQPTLTAEINERVQPFMTRLAAKAQDKKHVIVLQFTGKEQNVSSAYCTNCSAAKESCGALPCLMCWIQQEQQKTYPDKEKKDANISRLENAAKKRMLKRECCVLLEPVDVGKYNVTQTTVIAKPALKKITVASVPFTPSQLEQARKLSMVHLIREFDGNDAEKFLQFCTARMNARVCDTIPLITLGQADTELWHELRIGRITASRIREASRCTMMRGSLTQSIMGRSSGFSFAMKRGTDLEGHVLAELRKEYPALRNTGLILDPGCPWMGASPDGISDEFVLEIKCPYTEKTHACYIDVEKLAPKYYSQIQLQMHITKRKKALLAVAALDFEKTKQITKLWINYNKPLVQDLIESAFSYWRNAIFKELLRKRSDKK